MTKPGLYTSPHLYSYCERIAAWTEPITEEHSPRLADAEFEPAVEARVAELGERVAGHV